MENYCGMAHSQYADQEGECLVCELFEAREERDQAKQALAASRKEADRLRAGLLSIDPWRLSMSIAAYQCVFGCESYEHNASARVHLKTCPYAALAPQDADHIVDADKMGEQDAAKTEGE